MQGLGTQGRGQAEPHPETAGSPLTPSCKPRAFLIGLCPIWGPGSKAGRALVGDGEEGREAGSGATHARTTLPRKMVLPVARVQERPTTLAPKFLISR